MEQKEFENKLDEYAEKLSGVVSDGISRMEKLYEQTKENLKSDATTADKLKKIGEYPKTGHVLIGLGIVWLLYTFDVFDYKIFPILLIILGAFIVLRKR
jgi:hypothetical protein